MHRVICRVCGRDFEVDLVQEMELIESVPGAGPAVAADSPAPTVAAQAPAPAVAAAVAPAQRRLPSLPRLPALSVPRPLRDPSSPAHRFGMLAVGALAAIAALMVIQGRGHSDDPEASAPALEAGVAAKAGKADGSADFVRESTFSMALPDGWGRTSASGGATFAAAAADGNADATLWVERDAKLDFPTFEARSLQQLRSLAGSAQVVERVAAPTEEATVVRLAADAPEGSPSYEVTLRSAGPYRYYLATTLQPGAPKQATDGVELVHGTFTPAGTEDSKAKGGKG